jgi:flagellar motility protein MotE (MotC chaperone)
MSSLSRAVRRPLVAVSIVAGAAFCFKAASLVDGFANVAIAAEEGEASTDAAKADTAAPGASAGDQDSPSDGVLVEDTQAAFVEDPAMMSQSELALLRDLSKRRNDLDAREQDLEMRSRLLEATEKRVEAKIGDLKALEGRVKGLLVEHENQENEKLSSIVKVYEKMKPADAARILEGLDMSIQIDVAQRMSELRMAPIMSKMTPKAAQKLTTQLATKQTINLDAGVN